MNKNDKRLSAQKAAKARNDFKKLGRLLGQESKQTWEIGDLLVRCIDLHHYRQCEIAHEYRQSKPYLSQLYKTSAAYPPGLRNLNLPWYLHQVCRASIERAVREIETFIGEPQGIDYVAALAQIETAKDEKGHSIRDPRAATKFFVRQARERLIPPIEAGLLEKLRSPDLINQCHHSDCRKLLNRFEAESIKLVNLDPPYAAYRKLDNQILHAGSSVALTGADSEDPAQAVQLTCDVIRALPPLLKPNGVILLWQAATNCLRVPIVQAIEDAGLEVFVIVTWDKSRPQPGNFGHAYALRTEILYVIGRKNEPPLNHDDTLTRSNVLSFSPVFQKTVAIEQHHIYEKPQDMMEFLIRKHSSAGELVADLCGCSGSCCIAAHKLGRNWVYCESHDGNFAWGSRRVLEATARAERATA